MKPFFTARLYAFALVFLSRLDSSFGATGCGIGLGYYYVFYNNNYAGVCQWCPSGTYSDEQGPSYDTQCKVVPAGAYGIGTGIAPDYWLGEDVRGASRCVLCDINSWSEEGNMWINYPGSPHTWSSGCTACPEGKYGGEHLRDPDTCTGGLGSADDCSSSCAAGTARPAEVGAVTREHTRERVLVVVLIAVRGGTQRMVLVVVLRAVMGTTGMRALLVVVRALLENTRVVV
jgi:hypothetical protein